MLGVRELDQDGIAAGDRNWSNLHTVYTHGNGVIAAYGNQRPEDDERQSANVQWAEGQEANERALTNLSDGRLRVPRLLRRAEPVVLHRRQEPDGGSDVELDLPKGERDDENQTTTYDGDGGVPIGSSSTRCSTP